MNGPTRRGKVLLAALSGGLSGLACGCTGVQRVNVHGWADSYRLDNGHVEMAVVPQIARVMSFGPAGGPNLLWTDPALYGRPADLTVRHWQNFGGAKVWVAPQSAWTWPPDKLIDRGPCVARVTPEQDLELIGALSGRHGVRVDRRIRLLPDRPVAEIVYTLRNGSKQHVCWGLWSVLQLRAGGCAVLPAPDGSRYWLGDDAEPADRLRPQDGLLVIPFEARLPKVFLVCPEGWAAYRTEQWVLVLSFEADPHAAYPPQHGSVEFYTGEDYVELEHVGPRVDLAPGQTADMRERWHVYRLPTGTESPAAVARFVDARLRTDPAD